MGKEEFIDALYALKIAINRELFGFKLRFVHMGIIQDEVPAVLWDMHGCYSEKHICILINASFIKKGLTDELLNVVFHEMMHEYCTQNNINDIEIKGDVQYHTLDFKKAVEKIGGECSFTDSDNGYMDVRMTRDQKNRVRKYYKEIARR